MFVFQLYHIKDIKYWAAVNPLGLIFLIYNMEKIVSTLCRLLARKITRNECEREREVKREYIETAKHHKYKG